MAVNTVHSGANSTGLGTWVQSTSNPAYVRIHVDGDAQVRLAVVSSETNGAGIGNDAVEEEEVLVPAEDSDTSRIYQPGAYYLNVEILEITGGSATIDAVIAN